MSFAAIAGGIAAIGSAAASATQAGSVAIGGRKKQKRAFQYNQELQRQQYEANSALMKQQMDYSRRMWDLENEYNSPASQMQRYRDAGLNPALMYSQGDSGNAGSVGGYDSQPVDYTAFRDTPQYDSRAEVIGKTLGGMAQAIQLLQDVRFREEKIRGQEIQNNIASTEAVYRDEKLMLGNLSKRQGYYLKGGDYDANDTQEIHRLLMERLGYQNRAMDDKHLLDTIRQRLGKVGISLSETKLRDLNEIIKQRIYERNIKDVQSRFAGDTYEFWRKTVQPKQAMGVFQSYVDSLIQTLFNVGGSALKARAGGR
ncbi:MAG: DNA pilot protein [Microviridae sp.]|nr:MAG: DNA pilot protein [Microviridae sp.]